MVRDLRLFVLTFLAGIVGALVLFVATETTPRAQAAPTPTPTPTPLGYFACKTAYRRGPSDAPTIEVQDCGDRVNVYVVGVR